MSTRLSGLIARDGARRITLDQLAPAEAVTLLREIIGAARADAKPDALRELARRCAGLPLALRIAAGRVADSPLLPRRPRRGPRRGTEPLGRAGHRR